MAGIGGTHTAMATRHRVTATAGRASVTVKGSTSIKAPPVRAPAMTPASKANTRMAAAFRVSAGASEDVPRRAAR